MCLNDMRVVENLATTIRVKNPLKFHRIYSVLYRMMRVCWFGILVVAKMNDFLDMLVEFY